MCWTISLTSIIDQNHFVQENCAEEWNSKITFTASQPFHSLWGFFLYFFFLCCLCSFFLNWSSYGPAYLSLPSKWFFAQKCRPNRGKAADILHSFFPLLPFLHHLHLLLQSFFSHCIRMFGFENRRKWKHLWQSGNFVLFAFVIDNNKFDQK